MGGEKLTIDSLELASSGSPPHGRGKEMGSQGQITADRITPAWAGKRFSTINGADSIKDHPRMGGEKLNCLIDFPVEIGSPPRGRGKAFNGFPQAQNIRITPAWAGKR